MYHLYFGLKEKVFLTAPISQFLILLMAGLTLSSCAPTQGEWGKYATLAPGWKAVQNAAITAATDKNTWVPLAAAVVFGGAGLDKRTSDWAVRTTPLFGSAENARDTSDRLEDISRTNFFFTSLLAPSGDGWNGAWNKAKGLAIGFTARRVNAEITDSIKFASNRVRPDKSDDFSFPSGHTSNSSVYASIAVQNLTYLNLTQTQETLWKASSYTVAGLTAWARVEGNRHYPSDVLAGYALGNFLGVFISQAFINPEAQNQLHVTMTFLQTREQSFTLSYRW